MTYTPPTLVLVGAAQSLVLGLCVEEDSFDGTCYRNDNTVEPSSDIAELW